MTEAAVLFVRPGAIKPSDKGRLHKAGVVVVEVENPDDVKFVRAEGALGAQELPHGDLLAAAAMAIAASRGSHAEAEFARRVATAIIARHGGGE